MNIATGVLQPDTGTITVAGEEVHGLTPREATSLGIAIVHQHPAVLPDMTVAGEHAGRAAGRGVRRRAGDRRGAPAARPRRAAHRPGTGSRNCRSRSATWWRSPRPSPSPRSCSSSTSPPLRSARDAVELFFAPGARAGRRRDLRRLHHPPDGGGPRARRPRDRPPRRPGAGPGAGQRRSPTTKCSPSSSAGSSTPPSRPSTGRPTATRSRCGWRIWPGPASPGSLPPPARRDRRAGRVVGNGQSSLLRALAGLEPFDGTVEVGGRRCRSRDLLHAQRRTCPPTGTPRASR